MVDNKKIVEKFNSVVRRQGTLKKRAGMLDEITSLVSMMQNEGYVDEDILGMVEEALMKTRPSSMDDRPTMFEDVSPTEIPPEDRPTSMEPTSYALTERASVAKKFQRVLSAQARNK